MKLLSCGIATLHHSQRTLPHSLESIPIRTSIRSARRLQQMQPLVSSTSRGSAVLNAAASLSRDASMLTWAMSFTMTAICTVVSNRLSAWQSRPCWTLWAAGRAVLHCQLSLRVPTRLAMLYVRMHVLAGGGIVVGQHQVSAALRILCSVVCVAVHAVSLHL